MKSTVWPGLFLVIAGTACAAPAPPPPAPAEEKPAYGGQLTLRVRTDPSSWDPSFEGRQDVHLAYDSLLGFENGPNIAYTEMVLRPELAERWEVSPDARSFTFHLRRGARFANLPPVNGREVTANDVKWSIEYFSRSGAFKDAKLANSRLGFMYEGIDAVTASDAYTVQVSFKEPFVPYISYAASDWNPVVPKEIYDQDGSLRDRAAGSGPFQLDPAASQKGTRWVWKKNPAYWAEGKPYLDEIRWLPLPEIATAIPAFSTKQLDVIQNLPASDFKNAMSANPSAQSYKFLQPQPAQMRLSQASGKVTTDLRVRRAISMSLDRDEINKVFGGSEGAWTLPAAMLGLFTDAEVHQLTKQDLNEAKKLLAEAGYPDGVALEFPTDNSRTQDEISLFQLLQAQLKRAGMNVDLKVMEATQHTAKRRAGDFNLDVTANIGSLEADNDSIIFGEYHSKLAGTSNNSKINDPDLDRLIESQRREPNPEKRREIMRTAVKRVHDQHWMLGLIYPPKWDVYQSYVKNYYPHFSDRGQHMFAWVQK